MAVYSSNVSFLTTCRKQYSYGKGGEIRNCDYFMERYKNKNNCVVEPVVAPYRLKREFESPAQNEK